MGEKVELTREEFNFLIRSITIDLSGFCDELDIYELSNLDKKMQKIVSKAHV